MSDLKQALDILKQTKRCNDNMVADVNEKSAFGEAFDVAIKAVEKQMVKQPHTCGSYCPTCGTIVLGTGNPLKKYCEFCGQRLYE
jgi:biotin synthase-like enzyme